MPGAIFSTRSLERQGQRWLDTMVSQARMRMSKPKLIGFSPSPSFFTAILEVLSVPHVFRAESVGTARIPIRLRSEILEHSATQIVGNLSSLSNRIPIGKVNSDRTTRNYFRPVSDRNQVVPTGSDRKDCQNSNINRSPDIRIKSKALVIQNNN